MADHLAQDVFPAYRVGAAARPHEAGRQGSRHGRVRARRVRRAGRRRRSSKSASTSPNASVMLVEHAERFGLSQLHQLRGRVGRGAHQSYCVLLYQSPLTDQGRERLKALTDTTDGFEIAERDLAAARPGRLLRHAPVGHADAARRRPAARSPADGRGAPRSRRRARRPGADGDARGARARELGAAVRAGGGRVAASASSVGASASGAQADSGDASGPVSKRPVGARSLARLAVEPARSSTMRIIAGTLKGRRLDAPTGTACGRPPTGCARRCSTCSAPRMRGARVLDGYAGTGAVGIEALSRGAAHVTFVERIRGRCRLIERNLQHCGVSDRYAIIRARFADAARRLRPGSFDLDFPRSAVRTGRHRQRARGGGAARGDRRRCWSSSTRGGMPRRPRVGLPREDARHHVRRQRA